jgi:hypothetical protein
VAVEQLARQPAGAHGVLGGVAAGGVGQDGEALRRQHVQQVRLARVLADVGADGHGDDLGASGLGGQAGFFQVLELAGAGQQPRAIGLAGDHQRIGGDMNVHGAIIAYPPEDGVTQRAGSSVGQIPLPSAKGSDP